MSWFDTARLGMFVHWGHCSQQGWELSWPLAGGVFALPFSQQVPIEQYHRGATTFNPRPGAAREWARLASRLGAQYAVFTAKHHDGFAMFDTKLSNYSVMRSPCGRDLVAEFVEAMRAEGIRPGLYFSLIDWYHPDYPALTEADRPYRWGGWRRSAPEEWANYLDFMFGQVRELLTNYGEIDVIWFDGGWERSAEEWRATELERMIRELQPGILINDRLPGVRGYETPEQFVPAQPPAGPWETCLTINESWGYNRDDSNFKSARQLIHSICEVAGRGGNLLLNVSPMGDGAIQPEQLERLEDVATWMASHGESIVGTVPGLEPWQFYGPSTRRGDTTYLHLLMRPYDAVTARGVPIRRLKSARVVGTGHELPFTTRCAIIDSVANPDPRGEVTIGVRPGAVHDFATVIALELSG